jgi:hypothetical protein
MTDAWLTHHTVLYSHIATKRITNVNGTVLQMVNMSSQGDTCY